MDVTSSIRTVGCAVVFGLAIWTIGVGVEVIVIVVVVVVGGLAVEYHGPADRERGRVGVYIVGLEE